MSLQEQIANDLKSAMKEKDEIKTAVLRQIKAAVKNLEIKQMKPMTDEDTLGVIFSIAKSHNESIESFKKGNREDLVAQEEKELVIIKKYLPEQLSDAEIREIVKQAVTTTGATTAKDMGKVMGAVMPKVKGKADGNKINAIVREFLK
jgi:uncharacterized protein YqeY